MITHVILSFNDCLDTSILVFQKPRQHISSNLYIQLFFDSEHFHMKYISQISIHDSDETTLVTKYFLLYTNRIVEDLRIRLVLYSFFQVYVIYCIKEQIFKLFF